ncbi:MAG TPA: hypothetical protein VEN81_02040 [Planctomycetota bacterium]|nr:hypothetical protein [Planctomycetota bacterium]
MRHVAAVAILLVGGLFGGAVAQDKKPDPKKKPDGKVWMCLRGALQWEETFANGVYSKEWNLYKGKFIVEKEQMKVAEVPTDGHMPTMTRNFKESNVVIQFGFKLEGAKFMGIQLDDASNDAKKEHVAQLTIQPDGWRIEKMTGFGPTTKNSIVDQKKMKFEPGVWHTMVWEIQGDEMVATVDDTEMTYAKVDWTTLVRTRLQLIASGEWAWFQAIKVWKGEVDPKWPKKRAALLEQLHKK